MLSGCDRYLIFYCIIIQKMHFDTLNHGFISSYGLILVCYQDIWNTPKGRASKGFFNELPITL